MVRCHQTVIETLNSIKTKQDYPTPAQPGYEKMNICISFGMLLVSCHVRRYEKPQAYVIISKLLPIRLIGAVYTITHARVIVYTAPIRRIGSSLLIIT